MIEGSIIGIDLGGTNIRAGCVVQQSLGPILAKKLSGHQSSEEVLDQVFHFIEKLLSPSVTGIGIGVPGLVDQQTGTVFDVVNIPSWKQIPLQKLIEDRFQLPVLVNNDANCFALGEYYFGKGKGSNSMVGLTVGTGLGSGLILNKYLYTGSHCGAGEFGMIPYKNHVVEYYASGQFFKNVHGIEGEAAFENALRGESKALDMYAELGIHLGNAIKIILFALDVELIILGGSVSKAYSFFERSLWATIKEFPYQGAGADLKVEVSASKNSGILGAAALHYDHHK